MFDSFEVGIPFLNRPDQLTTAVNSLEKIWQTTIIIDNSEAGLNQKDWPVTILRPPISFTFCQSMNWLRKRAIDSSRYAYGLLHTDAIASESAIDRMLSVLESAQGENRRWGCIFSNYDAFAMYSTAMEREVGPWDPVLPQYFCDTSKYECVRRAGYEIIEIGGEDVQHTPSSTINSDENLHFLNNVTFPLYAFYYEQKHGGRPGQEKFKTPFNR
jgi:hypothetical protein